MAHKTNNRISNKDGAFHHDFNPFPQAKEDGWTEVNNKKQDGEGSKEKFIKTGKNGKEKQKVAISRSTRQTTRATTRT
eukprot:2841243-Ditylum_brightwellii.AAC.1